MQNDLQAEETLDVRGLLDVLRRRKWSVALVTVLVLAAVAAYTLTRTPIYSATVEVQVNPVATGQALVNGSSTTSINMSTEQIIAGSPTVAEAAAKRLGYTGSIKTFVKNISASNPTGSEVLDIAFSDPSPTNAARAAAAVGQAYLDFRGAQAISAYETASKGLLKQISGLQQQLGKANSALASAPVGSAKASQLSSQISSLNAQIGVLESQVAPLLNPQINPGTILAAPTVPTSPTSPRKKINAAVGLILGLGLGIMFAFLRERFDDRIASREELEEAVGAPLLAVVPKVGDWKKRSKTELVTLEAPRSPPAESYRTIRTNLQYIARGDNFKLLAVTSPSLGEGKTTTVANIAVTLAQSNKRVIAVSTDLRKPRLHRFFGLENEVGVTSILAGNATLAEAVQRVDAVESLRVIASGPVPPNPADLLASPEMEKLLQDLRRFADFVVIDTPPVLGMADALIIGSRSDGVVVVADAARSTRSGVEHVREQMAGVNANIVGAIFNNFDPSKDRYYPSYYRYAYSYRYEKEPAAEMVSGNGGAKTHASADPEDMWRKP